MIQDIENEISYLEGILLEIQNAIQKGKINNDYSKVVEICNGLQLK